MKAQFTLALFTAGVSAVQLNQAITAMDPAQMPMLCMSNPFSTQITAKDPSTMPMLTTSYIRPTYNPYTYEISA